MRNSTKKARIEKGSKTISPKPKTLKPRQQGKSQSKIDRSAADKLMSEANKGISNFGERPGWFNRVEGMGNASITDMIRGVDDWGMNRNV